MSLFSRVDLKSFGLANNEFAVALYKEFREREGNLFFSPYSIRTALAQAYAGARGRTASQMAEVLRLPKDLPGLYRAFRSFEETLASRAQGKGIEINIANAMWRQTGYSLLKGFLAIMDAEYKSSLFEADFAGAPDKASRAINKWVLEKTRGKIREIVGPKSFDELTRLVLANAIYFNGKWNSAFDERATSQDSFHFTPGKSRPMQTVTIPLMWQMSEFMYAKFEGFQALELPYVGKKLSMVIFLPNKVDGWMDFEDKLSALDLSRLIQALFCQSVSVYLPKFQFESSFGLAGTLKKMGMEDAFVPEIADFTGMMLEKLVRISAVLHKAIVEVDEAGTRAAAATIVEIRSLGISDVPELVFRADHPFIFMIRDIPSDAILFMGRVLNPL
jgi:serine protease inhibitor